ncbi:MAG TPA: DNA methyltransferase, partial [Thermoanaerobaculia bacterium]|nr:DNA methyltransferase [Thermoanaerobaculia bacterium]
MRQHQLAIDFALPSSRQEFEFSYEPIHVGRSTFKAGVAERIHRWFRLTPSFGPDLVEEMLTALNATDADTVLDPFCGAATTVIECQLNGIRSVGIEINPLLQFVGATSLNWSINPCALTEDLPRLGILYGEGRQKDTFEVPQIHDPYRWWRRDVLHELLALRESIKLLSLPEHRAFFQLALAGVLVPDLTNVTLGRLQLHFIDRTDHHIDVWKTFESHAKIMVHDLDGVRDLQRDVLSEVVAGDSTSSDTYKPIPAITKVVTSPPYPNRYSYVWNTRP